MPAEVVTSVQCAQYESTWEVEGSHGDKYTVTWLGLGAHCTCPGFKFSRLPENARECKHINQVWANGCFWNTQWCDGKGNTMQPTTVAARTVPDEKCPHCGGPVMPVRIAV